MFGSLDSAGIALSKTLTEAITTTGSRGEGIFPPLESDRLSYPIEITVG